MLGLMLGLALGADDAPLTRLLLRTSPGAEVQILPRVRDNRDELVIRGNLEDLAPQLAAQRAPLVADAAAYAVGSGTWTVSIDLLRSDLGLDVQRHEEGLVLAWTVGSAAPTLPVTPAPTVEQLIAGTVEADVGERSPQALRSLDGEAAVSLDPQAYPPAFPRWEGPELPRGRTSALLKRPTSELGSLDGYREVLTEAPDMGSRLYALQKLGEAHFELGLVREALYYHDRLSRQDLSTYPGALARVELDKARSLLALGRAEEARDSCVTAHRAGAYSAFVLECLALVAFDTASPPVAPTARALARSTGRPRALLLSGQLLLRANHPEEAQPLLVAAAKALTGEERTLAFIMLGDAWYAQGDLERARRAWRDGETSASREQSRVLALRQRMRGMVESGPNTWLAAVPQLHVDAERRDRAGAEALYLLAQIADTFSDLDGAIDHRARLLARYRDLPREPVASELWSAIDGRLLELDRGSRSLEVAALYREHWDPKLRPLVMDTSSLEAVTRAFERLGLADDALDVQREVFAVQTRLAMEDAEALLVLARLYRQVGRLDDALKTIAYLRGVDGASALRGELLLQEGHVYAAMQDHDKARAAWRSAASIPTVKTEAAAEMAMLDVAAGRCAAAVPALQQILTSRDEPAVVREGRAQLALGRCLLDAGDAAGALSAARDAAGRATDEVQRRHATWLAATAAKLVGVDSLYDEALTQDDDLWARIGAEDEAHTAFLAELDRRRR